MRALVISGGGNKGAFAGGIAQYLINDLNRNYDLFLGTSTGSLLLPLLSVGKVEKIRQVFTTVTQEDIFNSNPFRFYRKNGEIKSGINHYNILRMFMKKRRTLGESENLRKLIQRSFSYSDFSHLKKSGKEVIVTVANLSQRHVEYKQSNHCNYMDFCDWVWISSNLVPFMSLVHKDGSDYADGGFGNFVPIRRAIEMGAQEIDAIILRTQTKSSDIVVTRNVLELFLNSFSFMIDQIATDNLDLALYAGKDSKVRINYYFIPTQLTNNVLIFEPEQMAKWWEEGYLYAASEKPIIHDARRKRFAFFG
jgi:predicted patatin/cPLA2 family phospholipase